jgi:hypothetical protein
LLPGKDDVEDGVLITMAFGEATGYGAAYLAAFVRALERSQMAEEVGDPQALQARLSEAETYAARASTSTLRAADEGHGLRRMLEGEGRLRQAAQAAFRGPEGDRLMTTPYWEKLDQKTVELFREAGVDPREFADEWDDSWPDDPVRSCIATFTEALATGTVFANSLRDWGPEPEKPPTPGLKDAQRDE